MPSINICTEVCGREITVAINKGTGICCEWCKKVRNGELRPLKVLEYLNTVQPNVITPWEIICFEAGNEEMIRPAFKDRLYAASPEN